MTFCILTFSTKKNTVVGVLCGPLVKQDACTYLHAIYCEPQNKQWEDPSVLVPDYLSGLKQYQHACVLLSLFGCGLSGCGFSSQKVWIVLLLSHSRFLSVHSNMGLGPNYETISCSCSHSLPSLSFHLEHFAAVKLPKTTTKQSLTRTQQSTTVWGSFAKK